MEFSDDLIKKIRIAERYEKEILICEDISFNALSKIEEQFATNNNINITNGFKRFYPQDKIDLHQ